MQRIAVIGISGSGKTTFARRLQQATGLPLHHADQLFWRGRWQPVPEHEYLDAHSSLVSQDRWIIEGYVDPVLSPRLRRADLVVDLDPPAWLCAARVVKRWWAHRRTARPELPVEALETLDLRFLGVVLSAAERPAIEAALRLAPGAVVQKVVTQSERAEVIRQFTYEPPRA